jgi:hypothetical protein
MVARAAKLVSRHLCTLQKTGGGSGLRLYTAGGRAAIVPAHRVTLVGEKKGVAAVCC